MIGLIVGGVLVGQNLIEAATIRAQVTQIEAIGTAANTFRGKYNGLPADITQTQAAQFGIYPTSSACSAGGNDRCNNGFIDGGASNAVSGWYFFRHLSDAGLMDCGGCNPAGWDFTNATYDQMLLPSALGKGFRIMVYGGPAPFACVNPVTNFAENYYEISPVVTSATSRLRPIIAYAIDVKIDDGLPLTGTVLAKNHSFTMSLGCYWNTDQHTPLTGAAGTANCVSSSSTPSVYNTTSTSQTCVLKIKAPF